MYPQSMFWSKNKKNIKIFQLKNFQLLKLKKSQSFRNVLILSTLVEPHREKTGYLPR